MSVCACEWWWWWGVRVPARARARVTFSSREHRGGQLTLLGLDVAEREPARVSVGYHGYNVVRARQVTRGLQDRQPEHTNTQEQDALIWS